MDKPEKALDLHDRFYELKKRNGQFVALLIFLFALLNALLDRKSGVSFLSSLSSALPPVSDSDLMKHPLGGAPAQVSSSLPPVSDLDLMTRQLGALAHEKAVMVLKVGNTVLLATLAVAGLFGILCIFAGIKLMSATESGTTVFDFLGLHFTTHQAGVASIGLGAIVIILILRRVMKALENITRL